MSLAVAKRPVSPAAQDGVLLEFQPLVSPYGRDRRVALRIERMPGRARLSRGRNNGDGSWSLNRDELDDLYYLPPKGATALPTLTVRVVGLDSDNGATLGVFDHPVVVESPTAETASDEPETASRRETEFREMQAELAKARAALRTTQSELAAARRSWDIDLEQRLNDAADEAVATLEERRDVWMAETKERLLKAEARALERLEQARERWRREREDELGKAEEIWKSGEAMRMAAAEAHWQEQSARALAKEGQQLKQLEAALAAARAQAASKVGEGPELLRLRDENATLQTSLTQAEAAAEQAREAARSEAAVALTRAEQSWKSEEARRLNAAEEKWREESARTLADEAAKRIELETALAAAHAQATASVSGNAEIERLRGELSTLQTALTEREKSLASEKEADRLARERDSNAAGEALAKAEEAWKAAEAERLKSAEASWQEQALRRTKEMASRLAQAEAALADANSGQRRENAETRRLRAELSVLRENHAEREQRFADAEAEAERLNRDAETSRAALARAEEAWKKDEAVRFAAAEAGWQEQSARVLAELTAKLERAESELRSGAKTADDGQDTAELRRLNTALAEAQSRLADRESELESLRRTAKGGDDARREFDRALAEAKEAWEADEASRLAEAKAQWKEQSDRLFKKATVRLEGAEAALADARAEANTARDRRDSAELRRLRSEFAAMRAQLAEREASLAEAQVAAGRTRERTREEVEAAIQKAEETWKSGEAIRIAEAEASERERSGRALSEAIARLERTEAALADSRAQMNAERDRAAVSAAESAARLERAETALQEMRGRIQTLRDPANESELGRLRTELAALQVAYADREADLAQTRANARKSRESWAERTQASVQRAEDLWRIEEAQRLEAARREWQRDARLAGVTEMEQEPEPGALRKTNRLVVDGVLVAALAVVVVLGFTFYPRLKELLPAGLGTSVSQPATTAPAAHSQPAKTVHASAARAVIGVSFAKLRSDASTNAGIIATLARGTTVELAGQHGAWVHVHVAATGAQPARDGWVHGTSLMHTAAR